MSGRLREFKAKHPEATDDLSALVELGDEELRAVMGRGLTGSQTKAACVIEAARALLDLDPSIVTAKDLTATDAHAVKKAYTSADGLGWLTCEYFQALLGKPGVKADRMIVRFLNAAHARAGLAEVGAAEAHDIVTQAHTEDSRDAETLTHFEHAIWRAKAELAVELEQPDPED